MKSFEYTIKDKIGVHARPAGFLAKLAKSFKSEVLIEKDGKNVNAERLMQVMGMGIKHGDTVSVSVCGDDEDTAVQALRKFFEENL